MIENNSEFPFAKMFKRWEETRPAPRNFDDTEDYALIGALPTEKERFKKAALILEGKEDEILNLMMQKKEIKTRWYSLDQDYCFRSWKENLLTNLRTYRSTDIHFDAWPDGYDHGDYFPFAKLISLSLGTYSDPETQAEFEKYKASHPGFGSDTYTQYFFHNGEYLKSVKVPSEWAIPGNHKLLHEGKFGERYNIYEVPMTPGDFEIAGRALVMIKNRLLGIGDPPAEPDII